MEKLIIVEENVVLSVAEGIVNGVIQLVPKLNGSISLKSNSSSNDYKDENINYMAYIYFTDELTNYINNDLNVCFNISFPVTKTVDTNDETKPISFSFDNKDLYSYVFFKEVGLNNEKINKVFGDDLIGKISNLSGIGFFPCFYLQIISTNNEFSSDLIYLNVQGLSLYDVDLLLPQSYLYNTLNEEQKFLSNVILCEEVERNNGINCKCSAENEISSETLYLSFYNKDNLNTSVLSDEIELDGSDFILGYENYKDYFNEDYVMKLQLGSSIKFFNFSLLKNNIRPYCYSVTKNIFGHYTINETSSGDRYLIYLNCRQDIFKLSKINITGSYLLENSSDTQTYDYTLDYNDKQSYYLINYSAGTLYDLIGQEEHINGNLYVLNDENGTPITIYLDSYDPNIETTQYNFVLYKNLDNKYFSVQNNGVAVGMLPIGTSIAPTFDISSKYISNFYGAVNINNKFNAYKKGEQTTIGVRGPCVFRNNNNGLYFEINMILNKNITQVDLTNVSIGSSNFSIYKSNGTKLLDGAQFKGYTEAWAGERARSYVSIAISKLSNYSLACRIWYISNVMGSLPSGVVWPNNFNLGSCYGTLTITFGE